MVALDPAVADRRRDARAGKIPHGPGDDHFGARPYIMERICTEVARSVARRHPDRARALLVLFPDRYLHNYQHRAEFVVLDFSAVVDGVARDN